MKEERIIRGVMASPGIAIGRAIRSFDALLISYNFHIPGIGDGEGSRSISSLSRKIP